MKNHSFKFVLRITSVLLIVMAGGLTASQWSRYQGLEQVFPAGQEIGGIPVGGLNRTQAEERIQAAYAVPVELYYQGNVIQASPEELGFQLDTPAMLGDALPQTASFWDFLWGRSAQERTAGPLQAKIDASALQDYLLENISSRYDQAAVPARPILGGVDFQPAEPGFSLDIIDARKQVEAALRSPTGRVVTLKSNPVQAGRPALAQLQAMLQAILLADGFHGLAEISFVDTSLQERLDFASQGLVLLPAETAFTAASTMKIPVMISVLRRVPEPVPQNVLQLLEQMIGASDNPSTDLVVQSVVSAERGPVEVTRDLQALGLQNSFWAGYFYDGAPLLDVIQTPANHHLVFNTEPDLYNQTTAADMAGLLAMIQKCARDGSGKLVETFPGEITQGKCQLMVELLRGNPLPVLIEAGLPEGTPAGHKHGWVTGTDGLVHMFADAAVVDSSAGGYTLAIYLYSPEQLLFDPANLLFARLSRAVYNYVSLGE